MSTKAIRASISLFEDLAKSHRLGVSVEQGAAIRAALAEVEAIERAATWMYEIADTAKVSREEYDHHCKTMYAIYQQAKQRAP